nr:hypothetical protein [Sphingobium lactosutens]
MHDLQQGSVRVRYFHTMSQVDWMAVADMLGNDIPCVADGFPLRHCQIDKFLSFFVQDIIIVEKMEVIDRHAYPR